MITAMPEFLQNQIGQRVQVCFGGGFLTDARWMTLQHVMESLERDLVCMRFVEEEKPGA